MKDESREEWEGEKGMEREEVGEAAGPGTSCSALVWACWRVGERRSGGERRSEGERGEGEEKCLPA